MSIIKSFEPKYLMLDRDTRIGNLILLQISTPNDWLKKYRSQL